MGEEINKALGALKELDARLSSLRVPSLFGGKREAVFKARILGENRITIPAEEVEALGLKKGDLVQVVLSKVEKEAGK
ncbi:MAG: hypothetical protein JRD89_04455 [Deltaproteobacteria bacterium]|nr:hypothetical protein [Deltaproteobacteria bacterium]